MRELREQEAERRRGEEAARAQARARNTRARKKAKDDAAKEARRRNGLPLVDVHPSQGTLASFARRRTGASPAAQAGPTADQDGDTAGAAGVAGQERVGAWWPLKGIMNEEDWLEHSDVDCLVDNGANGANEAYGGGEDSDIDLSCLLDEALEEEADDPDRNDGWPVDDDDEEADDLEADDGWLVDDDEEEEADDLDMDDGWLVDEDEEEAADLEADDGWLVDDDDDEEEDHKDEWGRQGNTDRPPTVNGLRDRVRVATAVHLLRTPPQPGAAGCSDSSDDAAPLRPWRGGRRGHAARRRYVVGSSPPVQADAIQTPPPGWLPSATRPACDTPTPLPRLPPAAREGTPSGTQALLLQYADQLFPGTSQLARELLEDESSVVPVDVPAGPGARRTGPSPSSGETDYGSSSIPIELLSPLATGPTRHDASGDAVVST